MPVLWAHYQVPGLPINETSAGTFILDDTLPSDQRI